MRTANSRSRKPALEHRAQGLRRAEKFQPHSRPECIAPRIASGSCNGNCIFQETGQRDRHAICAQKIKEPLKNFSLKVAEIFIVFYQRFHKPPLPFRLRPGYSMPVAAGRMKPKNTAQIHTRRLML
jgi:hypothetical protein